jgi:two-component system chemotaxis response regulator CheB
VIAASAGGLRALRQILERLPNSFPAAIAIVMHRTDVMPSRLGALLGRWTTLVVKDVEAGEPLRAGTVYIAPPSLHLRITPERLLELSDGVRISHVRSSANPLFESAAAVLDGRVIAVVLTGGGHDATDGVQAVKARGGVVIAQDEASSEHFAMPRSAIATGAVDYVLPVQEIGPALLRLVSGTPLP